MDRRRVGRGRDRAGRDARRPKRPWPAFLARPTAVTRATAVVVCAAVTACDPGADVGPPPEHPGLASSDALVRRSIEGALASARRSADDAGARADLALAYHAHGLLEAALVAWNQSLALEERAAWRALRADVHTQLGDTDSARADLERAVRMAPELAPPRWRLGFLFLDLGHTSEAHDAFEEAVAREPGSVPARVGLARCHLRERRWDQAIALLGPLVDANPREPYFHHLLGTAYRRSGDEDRAASHLALASGSVPQWSDPWFDEMRARKTGYKAIVERASAHIASGRHDEALRELAKLGPEADEDVTALNHAALAHLGAGRAREARERLDRALALDPDSFATHANLSRYHERTGDRAAAMTHARRSVELHGELAAGHLQIGRLFALDGDYAPAAAALGRALRFGESSPEVRLMHARLLSALERWDEAERAYGVLLARAPRSAAAHAGLARARMELGRLEAAASALETARRLGPDEPDVQRATARLRELGG